jgi:hypothetical protein
MAVRVFSDNPSDLLKKVNASIHNGGITTWKVDGAGDLTHSPEQWEFKAWFRPSVQDDKLVFFILGRKSEAMSKAIYGVYHGRLIEMLLTHFDGEFTSATATALPILGDVI